jgi:capsular polysaccharide biosynthesis protein
VSGTRLVQRVAGRLIRAACRRLPADVRAERCREWTAELPAILDDESTGPSWLRGLRALAFCAGVCRAARQLSRPNDTAVRVAVGLGAYVVVVAGVVVVLGILAGAGYAKLNPPKLTSAALVVLPQAAAQSIQSAAGNAGSAGSSGYIQAQAVIASSDPVLFGALHSIRPAMSLADLQRVIEVKPVTNSILSISATGSSAAQAEAIANAVARSYIAYVGSPGNGRVVANVLQPAINAVGPAPLEALIIDAVIGAISGALIGAIIALAINRRPA